MKNKINQSLITQKLLSIITIFVGAILLTYMIVFEDEPGALPLFIIIIGTVWLIINQYRIKKQLQKE